MTSNSIKNRLLASGIHLCVSLLVAVFIAVLVFLLWYPSPYGDISGGGELFLIVIAVDVIIGPMITLVIFKKTKPKRELTTDLAIVGVLQFVALGYGLWTVFAARPVHLVFEYSRFSVVHAADIEPGFLQKAPPSLQSLPLTGPTTIALRPFKNQAESFDATMAALGGAALAARSDLWQPYATATADVLKASKPAIELTERFPSHAAQIEAVAAAKGHLLPNLRYLPLIGRKSVAWTVLIDAVTAEPVAFLPIDSF